MWLCPNYTISANCPTISLFSIFGNFTSWYETTNGIYSTMSAIHKVNDE